MRILSKNGNVIVRGTNGDDEELSVQMLTPITERWHYIEIDKVESKLKVSVDDTFVKSVSTSSDVSEVLPSDELVLSIGKMDGATGFTGCVGDVILNGKLISFSQVRQHFFKD